MVVLILFILVLYVTMVYGPIAALLVELFPARIRYSAMSLPYHIGNGWFGGFLPTTAFAMVAATGNIYYGLWYPIVVAGITLVLGLLFLPETYKRAIDCIGASPSLSARSLGPLAPGRCRRSAATTPRGVSFAALHSLHRDSRAVKCDVMCSTNSVLVRTLASTKTSTWRGHYG